MTRSVAYAIAAYGIWGTFPLYWTLIRHVPTAEVMGHRIAWSCLVLAMLVGVTRRTRVILAASSGVLGLYGIAAVLIGINWTIYVWAVASGFIVQTSLGYFITPLVNVLLGVVVLRERLRRLQWVAVALATAGVAQLTWVSGAPPWIALGLAASFGTYSLIKKRAPLPPVEGLFVETAVLALPALGYLVFLHRTDAAVFLDDGFTDAVMMGTGPLTVIPLLLFAAAVRHVPLTAMGILQFFSPTMQFLIGVYVFREPFTAAQFFGFLLVWAAVVLFTAEGLRTRREVRVFDEAAG